ncbi:hypothetical protein CANINC_001344 [Pichia inconspicua]|uniref:Aminotransferase class I/classII large domain-containing protein n=1 Tax=Pichia inconspicua TaxID=52247 RepID=A0A4T0X3V5_9ASCO|nr:hypothetical protein CANINC_001344 [[Candida] inconspicua]
MSIDAPTFNHEDFISDRSKGRKVSYFWENVPHVENPHPALIQLVGGLPNHGFFPVESASVELRDKPFSENPATTFEIEVDPSDPTKIGIRDAFQYNDDEGLGPLREQIRDIVKRVVKPISSDWDVLCTHGGLDGIMKVFDVIINPGDVVLFEEFTFTPVLSFLEEKGGVAIPIKLEKCFSSTPGLDYADELTNLLENWSTIHPDLPKPKLLYTIPNGHNPLGLAQSLETKKRIYDLATKYNFMILEDEPYAYLNFTKYDEEPNFNLSNDEFLSTIVPSYLTLDKVGRVIRTETFSKVYSPGLRLGFNVINKAFFKNFIISSQVSSRAPSGYSQIFVNNTINQLGGVEGWIHWITQVRNEYLKRKNAFVNTLKKSKAHEKGYLTVIDPDCGMFVSVIINVQNHKLFTGDNFDEIMDLFYISAVQSGFLAVLGRNMSVDKEFSKERSNFIRCAISYASSPDVLVEAAERLSTSLLKLFDQA